MYVFGSRRQQRISLSSSQDSRNSISDKNLILSARRDDPAKVTTWKKPVDVGVPGVRWNVCQFRHHGNDDDHVLSVPVFGNRTSLRMMDDTLIVRIYAPHVPATFLFSRPF